MFQVAEAPAEAIHDDHVDRWKVHHDERRIVFFRLPIVRFLRLQEGEERDERLLVESCVFRAVADFLGRDPWELARGATGTSERRRTRGSSAAAASLRVDADRGVERPRRRDPASTRAARRRERHRGVQAVDAVEARHGLPVEATDAAPPAGP